MELKRCKTCGGQVEREGNFYVCPYCGNKWMIGVAEDINAVQRANAWEALRTSDFGKASALFDEIVRKTPGDAEAYWGRALSGAGIVYVNDLNENKKVPTCNNITEESFITNKDVRKAISLAPREIAAEYERQAAYIESVRKEWLEKARKEKPYDIFISYKDSDRDRGIERTKDSYDAQELYTALTSYGYRVFFSRVSLRDKVSEQYEPYIYNAIKTAKVMIVFGEKTEYFSAPWIMNEWKRFASRIEKGEKHKNSLVVVYKGIDPGELPVILRTRQCLDYGDITFLQTLKQHIERVIAESKSSERVSRISLEGGKISKKAKTLALSTIQTCEVGQGAISETSIDEKKRLVLVESYVKTRQWDEAKKLVNDLLFDNPSFAEALLLQLKIKFFAQTDEELIAAIERFSAADLSALERILNCAGRDTADALLKKLYNSGEILSDAAYDRILKIILPFNASSRDELIGRAFRIATKRVMTASFDTLLTTLDSGEVDTYIYYHSLMLQNMRYPVQRLPYINRILAVDEGNISALKLRLNGSLQGCKVGAEQLKKEFEEILRYSADDEKTVSGTVVMYLNYLGENLQNSEHCVFAKELLRYYPRSLTEVEPQLIIVARQMLKRKLFDEAQSFLGVLLTIDKESAEIYWLICLAKLHAEDDKQVQFCPTLISDVPEFNKCLSLFGENDRIRYIGILSSQKRYLEQQRAIAEAQAQREKQEKQRKKEADARRKRINSPCGVVPAVISFISFIVLMVIAFLAYLASRINASTLGKHFFKAAPFLMGACCITALFGLIFGILYFAKTKRYAPELVNYDYSDSLLSVLSLRRNSAKKAVILGSITVHLSAIMSIVFVPYLFY